MSNMISQDANKLGKLLALAGDGESSWDADDMAQIWQHQLSVPLQTELPGWVSCVAEERNQPLELRTFADILTDPTPPLELLQRVKDLAKRWCNQPPFPNATATALYYAVIAIALQRRGERITELDDAALRQGFQWTIHLPWLDETTRQVVQAALRSLSDA
ncbi:MAG TPA: hypothetical protein VGG19_01750 [Tepidisphaeraceae bacterium]